MGLLGSLLFGNGGSDSSTWTKRDWDDEIIRLNNKLAEAKRWAKMNPHTGWEGDVERLKTEIANAKIRRRSAPN